MCGIVGAVAQRDVVEILVEGLRRLEYRGYDSAGVAVVSPTGELQRIRRLGKVKRVCAIPVPPGVGVNFTASASSFTLPRRRMRCSSPVGLSSCAT